MTLIEKANEANASLLPFLFDFRGIGNASDGFLSFAEFPLNIPFEPKRIYWTYETPPEKVRGHHAHKELRQVILCMNAKIEIETENVFGEKRNFSLMHPATALYIPPLNWRNVKFSDGAVLTCIASMIYSEQDYIRNYRDFELLKEGRQKL
jgi:hypothetical protein